MARKTKSKPKSPEVIQAEKLAARARDLEAVGLQREAAALVTAQDIAITRAGDQREAHKVAHDVARREDAFTALQHEMAKDVGAYDAARKLEHDMLVSHGLADGGRSLERVDGQESAKGAMDFKIAATMRVEAVLALMPPRERWLFDELIRGSPRAITRRDRHGNATGTLTGWRAKVAYVTGEENPVAQGAAVRFACINLRDAYVALEDERRQAANDTREMAA